MGDISQSSYQFNEGTIQMKLSKMVEGFMTTNVYLAEIICKECRERKISTNIKDQCKVCFSRSLIEFRCLHPQCNLEFRYLRHLCSHIYDDHHLVADHSCNCGASFPTETGLRMHRTRCNVPRRLSYKEARGFNPKRNQELARLPTYDCHRCGKKFPRPYALNCHVKRACKRARMDYKSYEPQPASQPIQTHGSVRVQPPPVTQPQVVRCSTGISDVENFLNSVPQATQSTYDCDGCGEKYLELLDLIYHQSRTCKGAKAHDRLNFVSDDWPEIGAMSPTIGQDKNTIDDASLQRGELNRSDYRLLLCGTPVDPSETQIMLSEDKNVTFEEFLSVLPKNQVVFFENLSIQPTPQTISPSNEPTPVETQLISVPDERPIGNLRTHDLNDGATRNEPIAEETRPMPLMTQFPAIGTQTSHFENQENSSGNSFLAHSPDLTGVTNPYPLETGLVPLANQSDVASMFEATGTQPPVDYSQPSVAYTLRTTVDFDSQPAPGTCFDEFASQSAGSYPPNVNIGIDSRQPGTCFFPHTSPTTEYSDINSHPPLGVGPVPLVSQSTMAYYNTTGADLQPTRSFVNQFGGPYTANINAGPDLQLPTSYLTPRIHQDDEAYLPNITTIDGYPSLWEVPLINS